ncbi:MAG: hypothetical protein AAFP99_10310, partial [Pseudomonadota bacterium]
QFDTLLVSPEAASQPAKLYAVREFAIANGLSSQAPAIAHVQSAQENPIQAWLTAGQFPAKTLIVLAPSETELARARLNAARDLFAVIDGVPLIAPGWNACGACRRATPELAYTAQ